MKAAIIQAIQQSFAYSLENPKRSGFLIFQTNPVNSAKLFTMVQEQRTCLHCRKPLQGRVLVVGVNGGMGNAFVLEILDEVDGEEAFADSALSIENEIETFHVF